MFQVAHIGYRVVLGQTADLHRELMKRDDVGSFFLVERLVDTGVAPDKNTHYFIKVPRNSVLDRADRALTERIFRAPYEAQLERFYRRYIRELNIDIVHAHFGMAACKLENVRKWCALPLLVTFYGVDASLCLKSDYWLPRLKRLFEYGDYFIVLSEKVKERLAEHGCEPRKIKVWNCLVDFSVTYRARSYDGGAVKILTAARFVEKKGYPLLLRAIADLISRGMKAHLTIVGYGEEKQRIARLIRDLGMDDAVTVFDTSGMRDFGTFYNGLLGTHHIFALASTTSKKGDDEAGPALSLISAQAAGLPVVCTPFVGSERSVVDGETGIVAREDEKDFASRLEYLIRNPHTWNVIGKKGSDCVRREFSIKGQTDKMMEIYREILGRE